MNPIAFSELVRNLADYPALPVSRLAPTPSGFLHTGNAFNFVLTALLTKAVGGTLRLRIDDLDSPRVKPEYLVSLFNDLHELGITWDSGPEGVSDSAAYSQKNRIPLYLDTLERLRGKGCLYACTCSRKELALQTLTGNLCSCVNKTEAFFQVTGTEYALRLRTPPGLTVSVPQLSGEWIEVILSEAIPNPVMLRRDGLPAYHIASLTDDLAFGINFIVRGLDLLPSTALQLYMAELLNEEAFLKIRFLHHGLVTDSDGKKLSKSSGSTSLNALRECGTGLGPFFHYFSRICGTVVTPDILRNYLLPSANSNTAYLNFKP